MDYNAWNNYDNVSPDIDGEYLVYIPYDGGHILIATYDTGSGEWLEYSDDEITHWMELPPEPGADINV
ncbi:hypothetical protein [Aggregatibacter actinomycetemcomitans]|uniref:hypothetical protein n=1 Tax=Aggregatibacter actinomycetemcomitans TaxID=714 RepID=UPI00024001B9|nr:hypothetical protein [Aggregatibacter actinomycetemcomitans]EHK90220.1 hypothetical protein RHAA1_05573 [Aggregatibacter actinomycetemcomitans RhAA1]KNE77292.1 hypothetical protein RHAA2_05670 [Aggregatibacter actinomycetemcomitans RhAA1]